MDNKKEKWLGEPEDEGTQLQKTEKLPSSDDLSGSSRKPLKKTGVQILSRKVLTVPAKLRNSSHPTPPSRKILPKMTR